MTGIQEERSSSSSMVHVVPAEGIVIVLREQRRSECPKPKGAARLSLRTGGTIIITTAISNCRCLVAFILSKKNRHRVTRGDDGNGVGPTSDNNEIISTMLNDKKPGKLWPKASPSITEIKLIQATLIYEFPS